MILNVLSKTRLNERYRIPRVLVFNPATTEIVGGEGNNAIVKDKSVRSKRTYIVAESVEQVSFLRNYPQAQPFTGLEEIVANGTDQSAATQITNYIAVVTSGSASNNSVKLPKGNEVDECFVVANRTGVTLQVFPSSGDSLNQLDVDLPVTLDAGSIKTFLVLTPKDDLEVEE